VHVGERLRALRLDRGLSQESAAARAGMTRNTLARHEAARLPDLKLSTMLALLELYNLSSLDDLVCRPAVRPLLEVWIDEGRPGLRGEVLS
jgi:transcriptional regulator with XRE-family HTH domain